MSTEAKPKTPVTATTGPTNISSEKATAQLKEQFSNLFGFFTKVKSDVGSSSAKITNSLFENGPSGLLEALSKKVAEKLKPVNENKAPKPEEKEKPSKEKGDKSHRENTPNETKKTDKEKVTKEKGDKSHREKTPKQTLKEGVVHVQPQNPPGPRYNSFGELFGSISNFISHTATSIQTSSSNVYKKLESGIDWNAKVRSGFKPSLIKAEPRKPAIDAATKKRLEEAKKMKENFEKQLRSLNQEIVMLEKGEESHLEEGPSGSRQNDRQPKKFRISGQKSLRENSDKSSGSVNQNPPKQGKKMLNPVEDPKHRKWQEGEKGLKSVQSQPLYMRMEKEFLQNVIFPELEARKEKLKVKREFYKPMDDKELREHALKYEERKKNLNQIERENEKLAPLNFAKSSAYKRVLEQEKEEKVKTDLRTEERKQLKEKQQQYGKIVKEMFFPKPDPKDEFLSKEKLQEIIARSQKAELPIMGSVPKDTSYSAAPKMQLRKKRSSQDIGQNVMTQQSPERSYIPHPYLKRKTGPKVHVSPPALEDGLKEHKSHPILPKEGVDDEEVEMKPQKKKVEKPRIVSMSPKRAEKKLLEKNEDEVKNEVVDPEQVKKSYPNYLAEVRKKRIEHEQKTGKGKYAQWEKVMKNKAMSQQEKMMTIMDDINRMEMQAKKKESKLRRNDPAKEFAPLELEDEVGEMYLESIKAKLAIIKDLA